MDDFAVSGTGSLTSGTVLSIDEYQARRRQQTLRRTATRLEDWVADLGRIRDEADVVGDSVIADVVELARVMVAGRRGALGPLGPRPGNRSRTPQKAA